MRVSVSRGSRKRKGSGIGPGSVSLHPGGHSHGPQPGAVERSLGAEYFDELAVMVDTFRPLELGEGGTASDDGMSNNNPSDIAPDAAVSANVPAASASWSISSR